GRGGNPDESAFRKQATNVGSLIAPSPVPVGLKPKDLVGMPWRLAFALQADGWWLRSEIIWAKPNPMPESVRDRPTKAHEQIFLLTKAARYYYDADAIREPHQDNAPFSRFGNTGAQGGYSGESLKGTDGLARESFAIAKGGRQYNPAGRNARSVWTIATAPFSEAHFATYPPELVRRCVLAGTSERGVCPACGAPWVRVVERDYAVTSGSTGGRRREADMHDARDSRLPRMELSVTTTGWDPTCAHGGEYEGKNAGNDAQDNQRRLLKSIKAARAAGGSKHDNPFPPKSTTGWDPECSHALDPVPAVVLDPFAGSGTTLMVAVRHGRSALGIELNESYAEMARRRILADHGAVEPTNGHTPPTGVQARMVGV
ncbi:MAG: site-specific DNA-methyltransferase, partial [Gemmatimonadales bacterium]|nr:site-specific DNA-methyltransferase [Gemmatimonadales bacterium]